MLMKKIGSVIVKVISGFFGIYFLLGSLGGLLLCFTDKTNPLAVYLIFTIAFFLISLLLLRIAFGNRKKTINQHDLADSSVNNFCQPNVNRSTGTATQELNHVMPKIHYTTLPLDSCQESSGLFRTTITSSVISNENNRDMQNFYSPIQAKEDVRILNDCIRILNSTNNLDTFFSRYELAMQTVFTLNQAKQAGIKVNVPITPEYIHSLKGRANEILQSTYHNELKEIDSLKTITGKKNRIDKFIVQLSEYYNEFEFSDLYSDIINSLNNYKKQL